MRRTSPADYAVLVESDADLPRFRVPPCGGEVQSCCGCRLASALARGVPSEGAAPMPRRGRRLRGLRPRPLGCASGPECAAGDAPARDTGGPLQDLTG